MPLESAAPRLDDRTYDDIVAEIRTRIASYAPEWKPNWNDLNDSDPGITLVQVFAWLAEMLLYRMARVPELNYIKFLELIGIELRPAQPARAEVTLGVADGQRDPFVLVGKGTQVGATGTDGTPIVFETEKDLAVLACALLSVQSFDGAMYRDCSTENAAAADGFQPFGDQASVGSALVLGLGFPEAHPNVNVFPAVLIDLAFWTLTPDTAPVLVQCGPSASRAYASARVVWEGWDGAQWRTLDSLSDDTLALTRTGHWTLRVAASAGLQRAYLGAYDSTDPTTGKSRPPLFWLRARIDQGRFEQAPVLRAVRLNTVPVLQAQTVLGEVLGGTDGTRNQTFKLANAPVIADSLQVAIDEGTGEEVWTAVNDLIGAGPTSKQLAVDLTSGTIRLGDGVNGAIPVANVNNPDANVIAISYRYGGGSRRNLAANTIKNLLTPIPGIDAGKTTNLFAAFGGSDEEPLDDAKKRAAKSLRARDRAVTPEDFEQLATEVGSVARAKALPLASPLFPRTAVPGTVSIIVVPKGESANPIPSDGLLRTVCSYLDARRLLTTELFVVGPRYVRVRVKATVAALDTADTAVVKQGVEDALSSYLHPLKGGDDRTGWPFGGPLRYSKVVQRVFSVPGVDSVPALVLEIDGQSQPAWSDVSIAQIAPYGLVYSTTHDIEVRYVSELEAAT